MTVSSTATTFIQSRRAALGANKRTYGVVAMTDGVDTSRSLGLSQILNDLPAPDDPSQVHIHSVTFGGSADTQVCASVICA
mmetsp:Transcript_13984/g.36002  ORF Transcript_13984/g.36002 Transcript_13984/m.36002 type:complete len:81 (-) Transcript_13984:72-314(-)